jgi:hypothetical protein
MRRASSVVKEDDRVTLLESRTTIEAGTTGMRTWQASLVLGEWLLYNPGIVRLFAERHASTDIQQTW